MYFDYVWFILTLEFVGIPIIFNWSTCIYFSIYALLGPPMPGLQNRQLQARLCSRQAGMNTIAYKAAFFFRTPQTNGGRKKLCLGSMLKIHQTYTEPYSFKQSNKKIWRISKCAHWANIISGIYILFGSSPAPRRRRLAADCYFVYILYI